MAEFWRKSFFLKVDFPGWPLQSFRGRFCRHWLENDYLPSSKRCHVICLQGGHQQPCNTWQLGKVGENYWPQVQTLHPLSLHPRPPPLQLQSGFGPRKIYLQTRPGPSLPSQNSCCPRAGRPDLPLRPRGLESWRRFHPSRNCCDFPKAGSCDIGQKEDTDRNPPGGTHRPLRYCWGDWESQREKKWALCCPGLRHQWAGPQVPPPYSRDWHQRIHQPEKQKNHHPPLQDCWREEGEGGVEQLLKTSPPGEQGNLQRQEQPRLELRGYYVHTPVIRLQWHQSFQTHNIQLDSSPAAMVMHRLTLVISWPCLARI